MPKLDPLVLAHLEWIGFVRPTGLVVSAPALVRAGAILDRRDADGQLLLRASVQERIFDPKDGAVPYLPDFRAFASSVLDWSFSPRSFAGTTENPIPSELEIPLPDYGETLRPDFAVREPEPEDGASPWQLLVSVLEPGLAFDQLVRGHGHSQLEASATSRMERLLRQTGAAAGLLFNGRGLRLISAPRGESSGWLDFFVADMVQTAGRPISTAMRLLLGQPRLLSLPRAQRLAALLGDSRRFQNEVSERLAQQVLHALYELLRGFQAAHDASRGELLRQPLAERPDEAYRALLTVILRLVFLLYAEERGMLPDDGTYQRYYSLAGLYERLREDAALYPDTMDQRYGAWAQLLAVFRMIEEGAQTGALRLPARRGVLFDRHRFPFLEGRAADDHLQASGRVEAPLVPDGTVFRAMDKLLVLDGERISYRALDVEQIGSVYETMMGFRLETATGRSVAVKPQKAHGAAATVDLDALLAEPGANRARSLEGRTDRKLTDRARAAVASAATVEDLHAALMAVVDQAATPDLVPVGGMVLQPSEERRRSGSHYTPRELTEPIVRTTLDPILARLRGPVGRSPTPEAILELKVCDPAMGSGAFLVEACRYLGDALVEAWRVHDAWPAIPPDEDETMLARRLVAQRCLYGVDRNPVAVDLAKMSLWLATLAKDHALTFVDHALRHGDSLVGLSRRQLESFHWEGDAPRFQEGFEAIKAREHLTQVTALRHQIRGASDDISDQELRDLWRQAESELETVRLHGDLVVAAWFDADKPKDREAKRLALASEVVNGTADRWATSLHERRDAEPPLAPFHWQIEFPEVFDRPNPGFDALVGNPPFAGKNSVAGGNLAGYPDWLKESHPDSHGNADLVAHFFRRAFDLLRADGAFGLIATNTIAQGDTRASGLRWICTHGGEIYTVRRRVKWPNQAAVVVSVVHVRRGDVVGPRTLDGRVVDTITAFLFHRGGHDDPARLEANAGKSFQGSIVLGMGFTFDDTDRSGVATPIAEMERILAEHPDYGEVILPYIGGDEVNTSPTHAHHRYVINFGERSEEECRRRWPELMAIVEAKVRPDRVALPPKNNWNRDVAKRWWQFGADRRELRTAIAQLERVVACALHSKDLCFGFLPRRAVFSHALAVFPFTTHAAFCMLQARPHEVWARSFGSSLEDRLRYTPSDCFETFPFADGWETHPTLEAAGQAYYVFRAALMVRNNEGLTTTYNRFHDPDERDSAILALRDLHAAMDRAVLDAYGWRDLSPTCEFLLDYEIDEDEWGTRKRPWRYRWPDETKEEVLARLLELNAERAREEARAGSIATKVPTRRTVAKGTPVGGPTLGLQG